MQFWQPAFLLIFAFTLIPHGHATALATAKTTISHQFTLIGNSKYPADFSHFDYVNPEAPKGGTLKLATTLNFDSLNPFNNRGVAPALYPRDPCPSDGSFSG